MHKNKVFVHENNISMHENEDFSPRHKFFAYEIFMDILAVNNYMHGNFIFITVGMQD